jgi:hypothetical protein
MIPLLLTRLNVCPFFLLFASLERPTRMKGMRRRSRSKNDAPPRIGQLLKPTIQDAMEDALNGFLEYWKPGQTAAFATPTNPGY